MRRATPSSLLFRTRGEPRHNKQRSTRQKVPRPSLFRQLSNLLLPLEEENEEEALLFSNHSRRKDGETQQDELDESFTEEETSSRDDDFSETRETEDEDQPTKSTALCSKKKAKEEPCILKSEAPASKKHDRTIIMRRATPSPFPFRTRGEPRHNKQRSTQQKVPRPSLLRQLSNILLPLEEENVEEVLLFSNHSRRKEGETQQDSELKERDESFT
jgi:hypothetical protein